MKIEDYPAWTCTDCAEKHGGSMPKGTVATWHEGECDVCHQFKYVTEPRDFGYPKFNIGKGQ